MQRFGEKNSGLQEPTGRAAARQDSHLRDRVQRSERHELPRQKEHFEKVRLQFVFHHARELDHM